MTATIVRRALAVAALVRLTITADAIRIELAIPRRDS